MIILLVTLIVAVGLGYWITRVKVSASHRVLLVAVSLLAVFGTFILMVMIWSASSVPFHGALGHYVIDKFSEDYDTIGRITFTDRDGDGIYTAFPSGAQGMVLGVYHDGKIYTIQNWFGQDVELTDGVPIDFKFLWDASNLR